MKSPERPADVVLAALRRADLDYRCTATGAWGWKATCPVCRFPGHRTLRITELGEIGAPISLRCSNGCREDEILAALTAAAHTERGVAA